MGCCFKPQADIMVFREFEITLISARDLHGRTFSKTKVYAGVSIGGGAEKQSRLDTENGRNPALNFNNVYPIDDSAVRNDCTRLIIKLYCQRRWLKDKCIGEVSVSLKELKDKALSGTEEYQVRKGPKVYKGMLQFSYRFGAVAAENPSLSWIKTTIDVATTAVSLAACTL